MARAKAPANGRLEETVANLAQAQANLVQAQALLVQNQAALVAQQAETDRHRAETDRQRAETDRQRIEWERVASERFARIEAVLAEHTRILRALPDAIREKIGFRPPEKA